MITADRIVIATLTDGGCTYLTESDAFLASVDQPTYVVGGVVPSHVISVHAFGSSDVLPLLSLARVKRAGVGTWTHNGDVYVDLVDVYTDRELALAVARERGELAIWDALAQTEIPATPVAAR